MRPTDQRLFMRWRPSVAGLGAWALACLSSGAAPAAGAPSPWVKGAHSAARLIDGGPAPMVPGHATGGDGRRLAAVEIRLDPDFITYWRDPGDAGVPPSFDFSASDNVAATEVLYPAPMRLDEGGSTAFGYTGGVTFPILVTPKDPDRPVRLGATVSYAVCHAICLPARADLSLPLEGGAPPSPSPAQEALAAVPRLVSLGPAAGPLAILHLAPETADSFAIEAHAPAGSALFVEAPEPWIYEVGAQRAGPDGTTMFPVKRVEGPSSGGPASLTVTLVSPDEPRAAIETTIAPVPLPRAPETPR